MNEPIFKVCPCCKKVKLEVELRRMNTQYQDDDLNLMVSCKPCYDSSEEDWAEKWLEYRGGL